MEDAAMIMSSREKVFLSLGFILTVIIVIGVTWVFATGLNASKADTILTDSPVSPATPSPTLETTSTTGTLNEQAVGLVLQPGYNLKTIPYTLSPNDGKTVLLGLATHEAYAMSDGQWKSLYGAGTITPGQGIWIRSAQGETYQLPVSTTSVDATKPFTIHLKKGWNAVGNPFAKDITWNPMVKTVKGVTSFNQAMNDKIISSGQSWDPITSTYKPVTTGTAVKAFEGILLKAGGDNIDLIITP